MIKKKICVVTGSRAEYDQLFWLLKLLKEDKKIILNLIVSGAHLEKKNARWNFGIFVGIKKRSDEIMISTEEGIGRPSVSP